LMEPIVLLMCSMVQTMISGGREVDQWLRDEAGRRWHSYPCT
jgi:hypothetical protein